MSPTLPARRQVTAFAFLLHGLLCPGMAHMFSLVPRHGPTASKSWSARLLDGSVLAIRQMWHAYWHWRIRQAMLMFLHSLDERTLKDFGVTQEEMHSFLDKQFTRARCQRQHEAVAMLNATLRCHQDPTCCTMATCTRTSANALCWPRARSRT